MISYRELATSLDAANSTTLLFPDKKPTYLADHEVSPSKSGSKDLDQSFLTERFPGASEVSNNRQGLEGEKISSSRKEVHILQGDYDPLPRLIQDDGNEDQNVSTTSTDDLGFRVEDISTWLELEESMRNNTQLNSSVAVPQKKTAKGESEKIETPGAEISRSSSSSSPPPLPPSGTFKRIDVPWLPKVSTLRSKCVSTSPIRVLEHLANKSCPRNCSGNGVCNYDVAKCRCFHGYTGAACDLDKDFECNLNPNNGVEPERGFGLSISSICSATCDKRKGFCYCGEGTDFPDRPVAEQCGFPQILGTVYTFDWTVQDPDTFTRNTSRPGWCNVNPYLYYKGKTQKKKHCYCTYDGLTGEFCQYHTQSTCVNQCSGNGFCRNGFCACEEGWYGIDCSIPSVKTSMISWPSWLSSDGGPNSHQPSDVGYHESNNIYVERRRPLIYVYDLPAKFNSHLLEGRNYKYHCVNRLYDVSNWTYWSDDLYGAEIAFLESLLVSKHRTNNADEADFFYVPVLGACAIARGGDSPHMTSERRHYGIRTYFAGDVYYKKAYHHIRKNYPYWDRNEGHDHIWMFAWDEGACVSPKEIWNSMMLVHWGNTNSKYNYSTSAYSPDNWNMVPKYWRGNNPCYDPEKDLVIPSWKSPYVFNESLLTRKINQRPTLLYFRGNLGSKYQKGRPEPMYSMGIRQRVGEEFGTEPTLEGCLGRQNAPDVKVFHEHSTNYSLELASSRFCGVFPGDGWSGRLEDSILHGCIPVIIQDGIDLPFENVLDYSKFAVRIAEEQLPLMVHILRSIPEEKVDEMQSVVQTIWQRFTYHKAIRLEADRQEIMQTSLEHSRLRSWMGFKNLRDDDAVDTFIQVLHYKLLQRALEPTSKHVQIETSVTCYNYSYEVK
ncbi:unnamed protein product [Calypogeia fissa]